MQLTIERTYGKRKYLVTLEVHPLARGLWLVVKTSTIMTPRTTKVVAKNGDLIRLIIKPGKKGISREVHVVYDLSTARRAESTHIRSNEFEALRRIDYWSRRIVAINESLERWKELTETEKSAIRDELGDLMGAFWGTKTWQQELALQKVVRVHDLRDSLKRPNSQAAIRALGAARFRLIEYRRIVVNSIGVASRVGVEIEAITSDYKRRFAELRELLRYNLPQDPSKAKARFGRIRETLLGFAINNWLRPAQEAMRFVAEAEKLYETDDRRGANRILRSIPVLFSCESRLSRIVERIHQIQKMGSNLDRKQQILAADLVYSSILKVVEKISLDHRAGQYHGLAAYTTSLATDAELAFRIGKIAIARKSLRDLEDRIRSRT